MFTGLQTSESYLFMLPSHILIEGIKRKRRVSCAIALNVAVNYSILPLRNVMCAKVAGFP